MCGRTTAAMPQPSAMRHASLSVWHAYDIHMACVCHAYVMHDTSPAGGDRRGVSSKRKTRDAARARRETPHERRSATTTTAARAAQSPSSKSIASKPSKTPPKENGGFSAPFAPFDGVDASSRHAPRVNPAVTRRCEHGGATYSSRRDTHHDTP